MQNGAPQSGLRTVQSIGFECFEPEQYELAIGEADNISCASMRDQPLFDGCRVRSGAHIDLSGVFKPYLRKTDDTVVKRTDALAVDGYAGALKYDGDLVQPLNGHIIERSDIHFELTDLCASDRSPRKTPEQITLFEPVKPVVRNKQACVFVRARKRPVEGSPLLN